MKKIWACVALSLCLQAKPAFADNCGETPSAGVLFCGWSNPWRWVMVFGFIGTYFAAPTAATLAVATHFDDSGHANTGAYVAGAGSIAGGAMLLAWWHAENPNSKFDRTPTLAGLAIGVGAATILSAIIRGRASAESSSERMPDDVPGGWRLSVSPTIVEVQDGNPAFGLSLNIGPGF